ncbi:MAG: hypothetical protein BWY32_03078 [bacterium ADurb.Bin243]|nr:MAG: hypothetical protein BWY32_03078 [bacterium ADurb.Bin243]
MTSAGENSRVKAKAPPEKASSRLAGAVFTTLVDPLAATETTLRIKPSGAAGETPPMITLPAESFLTAGAPGLNTTLLESTLAIYASPLLSITVSLSDGAAVSFKNTSPPADTLTARSNSAVFVTPFSLYEAVNIVNPPVKGAM